MPQGSWLDPLVFLIMIDDLKLGLTTHKFMDDTTITEVIKKCQASQTKSAVWMSRYHSLLTDKMNVNTRKTMEMVLGPLASALLLRVLRVLRSMRVLHGTQV